MAEFVEQGLGVAERDQRLLALGALGAIEHVDDDRPHILAVELRLRAKTRHPCAAALGRSREIVADEQSDMLAPRVGDIEGARFRIVEREIGALGKGQSEQVVRNVEGGANHGVEVEIGADFVLVDIVIRLAQLLGIVAPVVRGDLEIAALGRDQFLQLAAIALRRGLGRRPDFFEQRTDVFGRLRHLVGELEMRVRGIAEHARAFVAQAKRFGGDRAIVARAFVLAARDPRGKCSLTQIPA